MPTGNTRLSRGPNVPMPNHDMVTRHHTTPSDAAGDTMPALNTALLSVRTLAHEMAGLIDASGRSVRLAETCLTPESAGRSTADVPSARHHLQRASVALGFAGEALRGTMRAINSAEPLNIDAPSLARVLTIGEAVDSAVSLHTPLAEARGVVIESNIGETVSSLPALCLFNVLSNGVRNAAQAAASPGGRVAVRVSLKQERLVIEITNDGPGPEAETISRAFEPGYSTTGGQGLGLAVCRRLIQSCGGRLTLARGPDGLGAVFRAEVPLTSAGPWLVNEWGE